MTSPRRQIQKRPLLGQALNNGVQPPFRSTKPFENYRQNVSYNWDQTLSSGVLYDPLTEAWAPSQSMNGRRYVYTATLLNNAKVLIAGGLYRRPTPPEINYILPYEESYDPATGTWTAIAPMDTARWAHTATLLPSGQVLVAGGANTVRFVGNGELFDPESSSWIGRTAMMVSRAYHTATLLPNGTVLIAGGVNSDGALASAELYSLTADPPCNTSALEAQVAQLQSQLVEANSSLQTLTSQKEQLTVQLDTANAQITDLTSQNWQLAEQLVAASAEISALTIQNAQLASELSAAQAQSSMLQAQLMTLANGLGGGIDMVTTRLQQLFGNAQFRIPGATALAQCQSLIQGIVSLNKGQIAGLYVNLGGKPGK